MPSTKRTGRWLVRSGLNARALFGSVELDLTEAVLEQREITITANAVFGEVIIRVPEGVILHDEGSAIFGSRKLTSMPGTVFGPETPVVHVQGVALFGAVVTVIFRPATWLASDSSQPRFCSTASLSARCPLENANTTLSPVASIFCA